MDSKCGVTCLKYEGEEYALGRRTEMSRSTWLTILLVVICAGVAFAVYTRMHSAALPPNFHW